MFGQLSVDLRHYALSVKSFIFSILYANYVFQENILLCLRLASIYLPTWLFRKFWKTRLLFSEKKEEKLFAFYQLHFLTHQFGC